MKVAFLRSVSIHQAQPFLKDVQQFATKEGLALKLFYTENDYTEGAFPGDLQIIPAEVSSHDIAKEIAAWGANAAISISLPDDNSLRDACVGEILREQYHIPMIMHSAHVTSLLCNKWATKECLREFGHPVTPGFLISGDLVNDRGIRYTAYRDYILKQVGELGFPVVVKPLWDSMSSGIIMIKTLPEFENWFASPPAHDVVVERFLDGDLFGIEVLGREGMYRCQPLIRKCSSDNNLFPFDHIRFGPMKNESLTKTARAMAMDIAQRLNICGSIDIEVVYHHGTLFVIEINPRVSGMTTLSSAVSGFNAYQCLMEMSTDRWESVFKETKTETFAAEFPLNNVGDETLLANLQRRSDAVYASRFDYHDGTAQFKMLLHARDAEDCLAKILSINSETPMVSKNVVNELREYITMERAEKTRAVKISQPQSRL